MSVKNAMRYINEMKDKREIRERVYAMDDQQLKMFLVANGYYFNYEEFEDSIFYLLDTVCKTEEEKQKLTSIALWSNLLISSLN